MKDDKNTSAKKPWTGEEFAAFAIAFIGTSYGWQAAIASELKVNDRTVRR